MKRTLALVMALAMLLTCCAALAEDKDYTTWNPAWDITTVETATYQYWEPNWPIATEENPVKLTVMNSVQSDAYLPPDDTWFWPWAEMATGIDFEVITVTEEAKAERRNLMFASDELPDVMIGMGLTAADVFKYGVQEEQLLELTPYINEETMPYLTKWFEVDPTMKAIATTPDGKIYTLPKTVKNSDYEGVQLNYCYNMNWLKEVYTDLPEIPDTREEYEAWLEITADVLPHTIDEFTELVYAFKANHPDGYPIAGVDAKSPFFSNILNAFGYISNHNDSTNAYGFNPAVKSATGELVLPCTDDNFYYFLELLHQYYVDGIFHPDYFSADALTTQAQMADGTSGIVSGGNTYGYLPQMNDYHQWDVGYPLTSAYSADVPMIGDRDNYGVGGCVLSAECENPEAALKFLDFFYSDLGIYYLWEGPIYGTSDRMDKVIGFYYEDGAKRFPDVLNGDYENSIKYVRGVGIGQSGAFGNRSCSIENPEKYTTMMITLQHVEGVADENINYVKWAYDHGDNYGRIGATTRSVPYIVQTFFPYTVYYDADTQDTIDNIKILLDDYVRSGVAKFITGATELNADTFKAFVDECNSYGAQELLEIYQGTYANYIASQE